MPITHMLIANRGEIAVRIARAAAELGIATTAVFAVDDEASGHVKAADRARPLTASGARAYLDIEALRLRRQGKAAATRSILGATAFCRRAPPSPGPATPPA